MKRMIGLALLGLALTVSVQARADGIAAGTWRLTLLAPAGNMETTNYLLKVEVNDGKATATLASFNPGPAFKGAKLVSFTAEDQVIRVVVKTNTAAEQTFTGRLSKDGKKVSGVMGNDTVMNAAYMAPTDLTTLEAKDVSRKLGADQIDQALQLTNTALTMKFKAQGIEDEEARAKVQKAAADAEKKAAVEVPKLYLDVVTKQPNTFPAGRAALTLLQRTLFDANDTELKLLAEVADHNATEFGPVYVATVNTQIADALLLRKKAPLAVEYASRAEKVLESSTPMELQVRVLQTLATAMVTADKNTDLKVVAERLAKLEKTLDADYHSKVPPFKAPAFAGRKGKSDRVVVMELFTGAQCPPCVASDVAFDVLMKNYKHTDLVMMQYHLHIPGPDPMTNADTEARWNHYRDAHGAKSIRGVPTALFNGMPLDPKGGGPMASSQEIYDRYRGLIDPLLETEAACKVKATARRSGDKVEIRAEVDGADPEAKLKLRLVLAEETIRFVGSNKIRFHHQVVRAMPGGVEGKAITGKNFTTTASVELPQLRQTLVAYLDNYAANVRPFPQPGRPLDFRNLRVIALVQDDTTQEILQAVQVEVTE